MEDFMNRDGINFRLKAIQRIASKNKMFFHIEGETIKSWSKLNKNSESEEQPHPKEKEIKKIEKEIESEQYAEYLTNIVDSADERITKSILGVKGSESQLRRYEEKYKLALEGKVVGEDNKIIVEKYESMVQSIRELRIQLDNLRSKASDVLKKGDYKLAEENFKIIEEFLSL